MLFVKTITNARIPAHVEVPVVPVNAAPHLHWFVEAVSQ